ncbi:MAG: chemotaxis protein CheW [Treponema sp.]|nr:chemotaxis protein CheW [Treponema sp.]
MDIIAKEDRETVSFLIFSVNSRVYAINIDLVQEIAQNAKVHPLPFVPYYIEGVINNNGTAYVAVNPIILFPNEKANEEQVISNPNYLIFNRNDDQFCMHISSIEIFYEVLIEDLEDVVDGDYVIYKNRRIKIFNPDNIENRLLKDLNS